MNPQPEQPEPESTDYFTVIDYYRARRDDLYLTPYIRARIPMDEAVAQGLCPPPDQHWVIDERGIREVPAPKEPK